MCFLRGAILHGSLWDEFHRWMGTYRSETVPLHSSTHARVEEAYRVETVLHYNQVHMHALRKRIGLKLYYTTIKYTCTRKALRTRIGLKLYNTLEYTYAR